MIRPLHDWLLVRVDPEEPQGPIVVVGAAGKQRMLTGEVLAAGPGRQLKSRFEPNPVQVGDKIAFFRENFETQQGRQLSQFLVEHAGENVRMLRANDVCYLRDACTS